MKQSVQIDAGPNTLGMLPIQLPESPHLRWQYLDANAEAMGKDLVNAGFCPYGIIRELARPH